MTPTTPRTRSRGRSWHWARRACSISRGEALAAWLHRVAYHVALRLRKGRPKWAGEPVDFETVSGACDPIWDAACADLAAVLEW